MADRKAAAHSSIGGAYNVTVEGETRLGASTTKDPAQGVLYVGSNITARGSVFALDGISAAGATTTYYLWVKASDGKLYISTTDPTSNTESASGTVVGSQS